MIQDYKLAALVHSQLVADVVHNEILRLGWDIHIEVTSYETALQDAASLLEQGYEALLSRRIQGRTFRQIWTLHRFYRTLGH